MIIKQFILGLLLGSIFAFSAILLPVLIKFIYLSFLPYTGKDIAILVLVALMIGIFTGLIFALHAKSL